MIDRGQGGTLTREGFRRVFCPRCKRPVIIHRHGTILIQQERGSMIRCLKCKRRFRVNPLHPEIYTELRTKVWQYGSPDMESPH